MTSSLSSPSSKTTGIKDDSDLWKCFSVAKAMQLVVLYSLLCVVVYCYSFQWNVFDALCVATMNLSFFGRASYMTTHATRLSGTVLSSLGSILSIYMFSTVVYSEISSSHTPIRVIHTEYHEFNQKVADIYRRRLYVPITHLVVTIAIGIFFFMHNENWALTDALSYAVMQHIAVGSRGWLDHSLTVQSGTSKMFLLGYTWVFSVSVMHFVGNLCAYRMEYTNVLEEKRKSTKQFDLSALMGHTQSNEATASLAGISTHEVLVHLLVQLEVLDKEVDVDQWMTHIQMHSQKKHEISPQELRDFLAAMQSDQLCQKAMEVSTNYSHNLQDEAASLNISRQNYSYESI